MHGIDEQINCCEAAGQEGTPPPVVVLDGQGKIVTFWYLTVNMCHEENPFWPFTYLCTQVEVAQQNCGLGAGDEQNNEDQEQESKHVVHLMRPKAQKLY